MLCDLVRVCLAGAIDRINGNQTDILHVAGYRTSFEAQPIAVLNRALRS